MLIVFLKMPQMVCVSGPLRAVLRYTAMFIRVPRTHVHMSRADSRAVTRIWKTESKPAGEQEGAVVVIIVVVIIIIAHETGWARVSKQIETRRDHFSKVSRSQQDNGPLSHSIYTLNSSERRAVLCTFANRDTAIT